MAEIVFAPNRGTYPGGNRRHDLESWSPQGSCDSWTCKKTASQGDLYLFYFGDPEYVISVVGVSDGVVKVKKNRGDWDWTDSPTAAYCGFKPLMRLSSPIKVDDIHANGTLLKWWKGRPFQGMPKAIRPEYSTALLKLIVRKNPRKPRLSNLLSRYGPGGKFNGALGHHGGAKEIVRHGTLQAVDVDEPPGRKAVTVNRVIRDTLRAHALKALYGNACQLCGTRIVLPKDALYSEVHHLKPLGGKHDGQDGHGNMVVVCPRCHAELDYLAIAVHPKTMKVVTTCDKHRLKGRRIAVIEGHEIALSNLRYHWRLFKAANGR